MKILTMTVSYGETQSLPEYSNVKPALSVTVEIQPGDDPATIERMLWTHCRTAVQAQIDDALEASGRRAKYDPAPRYQVIKSYQERGYRGFGRRHDPLEPVVVVLPDAADGRIEGYSHAIYPEARGLRLPYALRKAAELAAEEGRRLIDCSDGDLTKIPRVPEPQPDHDDAAIDSLEELYEGDDNSE